MIEVGEACDTGEAGQCAEGARACDGHDLVCMSLPELQGHCDPNYVVGDVVSPGWCGVVLGNFIN